MFDVKIYRYVCSLKNSTGLFGEYFLTADNQIRFSSDLDIILYPVKFQITYDLFGGFDDLLHL